MSQKYLPCSSLCMWISSFVVTISLPFFFEPALYVNDSTTNFGHDEITCPLWQNRVVGCPSFICLAHDWIVSSIRNYYWHGNEPVHQVPYLYNYAGVGKQVFVLDFIASIRIFWQILSRSKQTNDQDRNQFCQITIAFIECKTHRRLIHETH